MVRLPNVTIPAEVRVRCPRELCNAEYVTRVENPVQCPRCHYTYRYDARDPRKYPIRL